MPSVKTNGIRIEYDTFGDRSLRPLLLIAGSSSQMISWDEEFCTQLVDKGHYVIRFDNRDVGLSSRLDESGIPDISKIVESRLQGKKIDPPYTLEDMAGDAMGLLDGLDIQRAHICGVSMGGFIAQIMAIRYPSRVLSLISVCSSTGNPELPKPRPELIAALSVPPPEERQAVIENSVNGLRLMAGSGFDFPEAWIRELAARGYDRSFYPQGAARHSAAIAAQNNRKPALRLVTAPSLVIHGTDDPLVPVEGSIDTADAIPGAELLLIEGMGHDVPHGGGWPRIIDAITEHTIKAGG